MKRALLILLSWLMLPICLTAGAAEPAPIIRAHLSATELRVGEPLYLDIELLVPGWFTAPPELPASFALPGVAVRLEEGSAPNINERINYVSYAGIRRRYQLTAQAAGDYAVPPVPTFLRFSDGTHSAGVQMQTPPQQFRVRLPPGAEDLGYFIASSRYTLEQSLDRRTTTTGMKVGDAVTRRIVQRALDMPAMQLPALQFDELPGASTYAAEPLLDDRRGERGAAASATRTDAVTYVLQQPGNFELPALRLRWYDITTRKMRDANLAALRFSVAPSAVRAEVPPTPPIRSTRTNVWRPSRELLTTVLAMIAALAFAFSRRTQIATAMRPTPDSAEKRAYRKAMRQLKQGIAVASAGRLLDAWFATLPLADRSAGLGVLVARYGGVGAAATLEALLNAVFNPHSTASGPDPASLRRMLHAVRRGWHKQQHRHPQVSISALRALNPACVELSIDPAKN